MSEVERYLYYKLVFSVCLLLGYKKNNWDYDNLVSYVLGFWAHLCQFLHFNLDFGHKC